MNVEEIREYCLAKPGVSESFPFDEVTLVFKVLDKMFGLLSLKDNHSMNLKCKPERAIELREEHSSILPGYHMNKTHWNTIELDGSLPESLLKELIDHSYELVVSKLPKNKKETLHSS